MKALLRRGGWLTGMLILSMPMFLIFFLGSQMAYGEVQRRYETYASIPEYTSVTQMQALTAGATVLLRGRIAKPGVLESLPPSQAPAAATGPLLIYQERPLDGREVRYLEEFPLVLPAFALTLADGTIGVQPSQESERAIAHEVHRITRVDREFTGFQVGDTITVQGQWQPATADQAQPLVVNVTGIAGVEKAVLLAEVQAALQQVRRARDGLGLLTLVSIMFLVIQLYRQRKNPPPAHQEGQPGTTQEESPAWHPPTTEAVPTT